MHIHYRGELLLYLNDPGTLFSVITIGCCPKPIRPVSPTIAFIYLIWRCWYIVWFGIIAG